MTTTTTNVAPFYKGWDEYQKLLVKAIAPLTQEQLERRATPHLRSLHALAVHLIAVRVRWFHGLMGEGSADIAPIGEWDRAGQPERSAAELVSGLEITWQLIADSLNCWTPADLDHIFEDTYQGETYRLSRQWVLWHVIEHDLHHGGEISFSLGMHNLPAIDI